MKFAGQWHTRRRSFAHGRGVCPTDGHAPMAVAVRVDVLDDKRVGMCPACFAQATGPGVGLTPSPIGKGAGVSSTGNTPWRVVLGGGG